LALSPTLRLEPAVRLVSRQEARTIVSHAFGGNKQYYEFIDIPDQGPYTIVISSTSTANLQIHLANR
jgi:hypothetical protein